MAKLIEQWLPGTSEGKTMRYGKILAMAKNIETAKKARRYAISLYDQCDMKVNIMEAMNSCQDTVFRLTLLTVQTDEIQKTLTKYDCTKVERIESLIDGKRSPNGLHILTFATRKLPNNVLCRYEVRRFYPNMLRKMLSVRSYEKLVPPERHINMQRLRRKTTRGSTLHTRETMRELSITQ
jgi:hypothetical protein